MITQDYVCFYISGTSNFCKYQMQSSFIKTTYDVTLIFMLPVEIFYHELEHESFSSRSSFPISQNNKLSSSIKFSRTQSCNGLNLFELM